MRAVAFACLGFRVRARAFRVGGRVTVSFRARARARVRVRARVRGSCLHVVGRLLPRLG